jgi:hypothetical protein
LETSIQAILLAVELLVAELALLSLVVLVALGCVIQMVHFGRDTLIHTGRCLLE